MLHRGSDSLAEISAIYKGLVEHQVAKTARGLCNAHFMYTKGHPRHWSYYKVLIEVDKNFEGSFLVDRNQFRKVLNECFSC